LKGVEGVAIEDIGPDKPGFVKVFGEYWRAVANKPIKSGCRVRVVELRGDFLVVDSEEC